MTTIATDGKSMAGDGYVTGNGLIHSTEQRKVYRLSDGRIVGISGSTYAFSTFIPWLEKGGDCPDLDEDFEALVLTREGKCLSYNHKCVAIEQPAPCVTGSGGAIAMGALLAGRSPGEAVAIACQRDICTGGTITIEALA